MAEKKTAPKASTAFTADEKAAMKERAREQKANGTRADDKAAVLAKLAEMKGEDRRMGERIYALLEAGAPELAPKLWYGMPAYYKDGKLICHFQDANKFKTRYATLGFSDRAHLDEEGMWPVAFALQELTPAVEARILGLVRRALS